MNNFFQGVLEEKFWFLKYKKFPMWSTINIHIQAFTHINDSNLCELSKIE